jgi:nucleoside-diphosphate-sugar epimerase
VRSSINSSTHYLMKIAVTGCNGNVGRRVVVLALKRGQMVVGIDRAPQSSPDCANPQFKFIQADLTDYGTVLKVLDGCDGVIHLAACSNPGDYQVNSHNRCARNRVLRDGNPRFQLTLSNVVLSWNVFRACAEVTDSC